MENNVMITGICCICNFESSVNRYKFKCKSLSPPYTYLFALKYEDTVLTEQNSFRSNLIENSN